MLAVAQKIGGINHLDVGLDWLVFAFWAKKQDFECANNSHQSADRVKQPGFPVRRGLSQVIINVVLANKYDFD